MTQTTRPFGSIDQSYHGVYLRIKGKFWKRGDDCIEETFPEHSGTKSTTRILRHMSMSHQIIGQSHGIMLVKFSMVHFII